MNPMQNYHRYSIGHEFETFETEKNCGNFVSEKA